LHNVADEFRLWIEISPGVCRFVLIGIMLERKEREIVKATVCLEVIDEPADP